MSVFEVPVVVIKNVINHPNADRLDICTVLGYDCIVSRDQFKKGDLAYYIPENAVLTEEYINHYGLDYVKRNGRIRAVKLRGVFSLGLLMSFDDYVNKRVAVHLGVYIDELPQGTDLSTCLGIIKWEPELPAKLNGDKEIPHPDFIRYTDMDDIKKHPDVLHDYEIVEITEKIHGTNFRFGWLEKQKLSWRDKVVKFFTRKPVYDFVLGSHNVQLKRHGKSIYCQIAEEYKQHAKRYPNHIFFGEIYGEGIQKQFSYGQSKPVMRVFDVYDVKAKKYLMNMDFSIALSLCKFEHPPVLFTGFWKKAKLYFSDWEAGSSKLNEETILEGWVIKSKEKDVYDITNRRIFKHRTEKYLLMKDGTEYH